MEQSPSDDVPLATVDCLENKKSLFSDLLTKQSHVFRRKRQTPTLTDREVEKAYDVLVEGARPPIWVLIMSHILELVGGGVTAFGWHFGEDHTEFGVASWTIILCGVALFALGIVIREVLASH